MARERDPLCGSVRFQSRWNLNLRITVQNRHNFNVECGFPQTCLVGTSDSSGNGTVRNRLRLLGFGFSNTRFYRL